MTVDTPLRRRLSAVLTEDLPVTATAVILAVALYPLLSLAVDTLPVKLSFGAGFLLVMSVMDVALVYGEQWPVSYDPAAAVAWTVAAAGATVAVFLCVYWLSTPRVGDLGAAVLANLTAVAGQFGGAVLYRRRY
jgi:hypothetical protein